MFSSPSRGNSEEKTGSPEPSEGLLWGAALTLTLAGFSLSCANLPPIPPAAESASSAAEMHPAEPASELGGGFEQAAWIGFEPAREVSGIAKSGLFDDVYWVHNDSGDEARLFAVDGSGKVIMPDWLRGQYYTESPEPGKKEWPGHTLLLAANQDWEDITAADGRLYIADLGNNGNARRDLGVYVLNEPNPRAVPSARVLQYLPVRYPDQESFPAAQWHFDCESIFVSEGRLHFITKQRIAGQIGEFELGARLYRLDTDYTDRENVLTLVDANTQLLAPTGAALSPSGARLAVLTLDAVWIFSKQEAGSAWLSGPAERHALPPAIERGEGVCWESETALRIATEKRSVFRLELPGGTQDELHH